jgi:geranylgeranyl diphosphate synthase type II
MGAILSGANDQERSALQKYGDNIGLAFQIADDLLNEKGTPEAIGKAVGSDRARGKQTYPALMGNDRAEKEAARRAEEALAAIEDLTGDTRGLVELARYSIERER